MAFFICAVCFGSVLAAVWMWAPWFFPWLVGVIIASIIFGKADRTPY